MTVAEWIRQATNELADELIPSPRLDAEIILAHTLRHPRTFLHAHPEETLSMRTEDIANARIELRKDRVPIAYIIGHKEFYGRRFAVTPSVLIPRPESEELIAALKKLLGATHSMLVDNDDLRRRLVDVGTGSGCLGITAKLEFPELDVTLLDTSRHALKVAEKNANNLGVEVTTIVSDLLTGYPHAPDIVVANLPYVDRSWEQSPELASEPEEALYADDEGLAIIKRCIEQASLRTKPGSHLLLEADPRQLDAITRFASKRGYKEIDRSEFAIVLQRS